MIWLTGLIAESAVRIDGNGDVVMSEDDFRALMADLEAAETERDLLREMLRAERESHDAFSSQVEELQKAFEMERLAWRDRGWGRKTEQNSVGSYRSGGRGFADKLGP